MACLCPGGSESSRSIMPVSLLVNPYILNSHYVSNCAITFLFCKLNFKIHIISSYGPTIYKTTYLNFSFRIIKNQLLSSLKIINTILMSVKYTQLWKL